MTFKGPFQLKQFCDSKGATAPFHALPGCLRAVFCVWSSQCSVERERERERERLFESGFSLSRTDNEDNRV